MKKLLCVVTVLAVVNAGAGSTCPWDCEPAPDGNVGINDFLALLGNWGSVGMPCDFDGGGVGINDFLELLGNWGGCPPVACLPDVVMDRIVDTNDFIALLGQWGCSGCAADINDDGIVDTLDLVLLLLCWGECPCAPLGNNEIFDQIITIDVTDPGADALGLIVTHVYATGATVLPGDSLAAGGNASIAVIGGTFYQAPLGSDTPPDSVICGVVPATCYDTFVTNQYLVDEPGELLVMPDLVMTANTINGTWFSSPDSSANLAVPVPTTGLFGVLIAQVTIEPGLGPSSVGYIGDMDLFTGLNAGGSSAGQQSSMAFLLTGACCLPGGTCIEDVDIFDCQDQGGVYQGDETTCTPNPCPPRHGGELGRPSP